MVSLQPHNNYSIPAEVRTCVRIGNGTVAPLHEEKLKKMNIICKGIIDTDENKQQEALKKGIKVYKSYPEAYQDLPSIWDICTPASQRLSVIHSILAIDLKAHIILEKPVCLFSNAGLLQGMLASFHGKISVNENYLCSHVTKKVHELAASFLTQWTKIEIEMTKNRSEDFHKGRYIEQEGVLLYEGLHMLTILSGLRENLLPQAKKITKCAFENAGLAREFLTDKDPLYVKSQGTADITYLTDDGIEINFYTSMVGKVKHVKTTHHGKDYRYEGYLPQECPIQNSKDRYRMMAIHGQDAKQQPTSVIGFYEPLPHKGRSQGAVLVIQNGKLKEIIEPIADDTMGNHLALIVDYMEGKLEKNPSSVEDAIRLVETLHVLTELDKS